MTLQWPSEQRNDRHSSTDDFYLEARQTITTLLDDSPPGFDQALEKVVKWILRGDIEGPEFEQRLTGIAEQAGLLDGLDTIEPLLAWVRALALAQSPSLQSWKKIRNLKTCPYVLDTGFICAMTLCAERHPHARSAYLSVFNQVFEALESGALTTNSERFEQQRTQFRDYWKRCNDKLDEVWWSLRGWDALNYEDEFPLFQVTSTLSPDEFIKILGQSTNPFLVQSALSVSGIGGFYPSLEKWLALVPLAPSAFEDDGTWNGSLLIPLLLVDARTQIIRAGTDLPYQGASELEIEHVKTDANAIIETVLASLAARPDAAPLFARWSTWIMRQLLGRTEQDIEDARNSAYFDNALIEAIGSKINPMTVVHSSPADASNWEPWCYRCVMAFHAHSGWISPPSDSSFLLEWQITPDEWDTEKGLSLRKRSDLLVTMNKEIPGLHAHLLAYPIVRSASPLQGWKCLWDAAHVLREIVEFGDVDASNSDYKLRSEAANLVLLIVCIGIAVLDQCVSLVDAPAPKDLATLHEKLATAVTEMLEIDDTLTREKWLSIFRRLATRRLIWDAQLSNRPSSPSQFFQPDDKPTFSNYLESTKGNSFELLNIIESALLNECNRANLHNLVHAASIDLPGAVSVARRLNQCHPNKYPINERQLHAITQFSRTPAVG